MDRKRRKTASGLGPVSEAAIHSIFISDLCAQLQRPGGETGETRLDNIPILPEDVQRAVKEASRALQASFSRPSSRPHRGARPNPCPRALPLADRGATAPERGRCSQEISWGRGCCGARRPAGPGAHRLRSPPELHHQRPAWLRSRADSAGALQAPRASRHAAPQLGAPPVSTSVFFIGAFCVFIGAFFF